VISLACLFAPTPLPTLLSDYPIKTSLRVGVLPAPLWSNYNCHSAEIPTFLTAGHETTSTTLAWTLYALSLRPDIQDQLRTELRAHHLPKSSTGNAALTAEEVSALEKLPFLDAVVRETLRLHCPVPSTIRTATQDDVVPLSRSFIDIHGEEENSFRVSKGDPLFIPILMINRLTELWGEDAHEWLFVFSLSLFLFLPKTNDSGLSVGWRTAFLTLYGTFLEYGGIS
jgi:hypothetical protein